MNDYERMLTGDAVAREQFAKEKLTLVRLRVKKFVLRHPAADYFKNELFSVGSLTLVKCINRASDENKTPIKNFDGYASRCIDRDLCAKWSEEEYGCVRVPARTQSRHRRNNSDEPRRWPKQEEIRNDGPDGEEILMNDMDSLPGRSNPTAEFIVMDEILRGCCTNEIERQIVRRQAEGGWTIMEIANEVGLDESEVTSALDTIYDRYMQRNSA